MNKTISFTDFGHSEAPKQLIQAQKDKIIDSADNQVNKWIELINKSK